MSYNSYKVSSYGSSGVSRGRGFSTRGSFRGRGGGDSGGTWSSGSTGRGRGFSGPSRGRFNWYKEHSSPNFESHSRYVSGSSGVEKYSIRGRGDDSGYRRYSRADAGDYSPRDHRDHRSPESQRKRMRTDHGYVQVEEDGELEEGETTDKKEKVKKLRKVKTVSKDEEPEEGEEVDEVEEDDDEEEEDDGKGKKTETKNNGGVHVTIKQDSDARAVSEEGRPVRRTFTGKPFIKLSCPHCLKQCVTFQEYTMHLFTSRHIGAMRKQSLKHKQTLASMRLTQRQKQRVVEESEEARGTLSARTKFCHICKLNYRQLKSKHVASEYHREMMKFLMPICYVCELEFKSPMLYENHLCSLDHIKRKAAKAERQRRRSEKLKTEEEGSGADDEDKDLNLDNFMILDSVGDVDDTGEDGEEQEEGKGEKEKKEGEEKKKKAENLGSEHVKTVEVYYCELCSHYLPRSDNPEKTRAVHCRTRTHLQRYVRHRDDEMLRKEAERIHRKRIAKRNAAKEAGSKKTSDEKKDGEVEKMDEDESIEKDVKGELEEPSTDSPKKKKKEEGGSEASQGDSKVDVSSETVGESRETDLDQDLEAGMDDKLWADVDKDLGELLREVEPGNKSSDEDDDSHAEGGRYDRFRYSEKGSVGADPSSEGDGAKAVAEGEEQLGEADAEEDKGEKKQTASEPEANIPVKKACVTTSTPVAAVN
ncbi:zinc finger protein on ecdysone puffs isoform X2 [Anabrus simplex]|uniref:zinc finger protein on ecdysone puffs isoform X2 n=1 Tax=Anabrus simplex TaxID=316456 RepID=UPI0035A325CC